MFREGPPFKYVGGQLHCISSIDSDRWSYFEALSFLKDFWHAEPGRLWWKPNGGSMLKEITWDNHALEMANYAIENDVEVELYIEHDLVS